MINTKTFSPVPRLGVDRKLDKTDERPPARSGGATSSSFAEELGVSKRATDVSERREQPGRDSNREGERTSAQESKPRSRSESHVASSDKSTVKAKDARARKTDVSSRPVTSEPSSSSRSATRVDGASVGQNFAPRSADDESVDLSNESDVAPEESSAIETGKKSKSATQAHGQASAHPQMPLPDFFSKAALASSGRAMQTGTALQDSDVEGVGGLKADSAMALQKSVEAFDEMKAEQEQTRNQAMQTFMNRMQSQLGVPPEKILQAFSQMSQESMEQAPENSIKEFVSQLDLKPEQEVQASKMYREMLQTTGEADLNEKLIGLEQGVNFEIMSNRDVALKKLNNSLDDLNQTFFRKEADEPQKAQRALEQMNAEIAKLANKHDQKDGKTEAAATMSAANMAALATEADEGAETAAPTVASHSADALPSASGSAGALSALSASSTPSSMGGDSGSSGGSNTGGNSSSFANQMKSSEAKPQAAAMEMKAGMKTASAPTAAIPAASNSGLAGEQASAAAAQAPQAPATAAAAGPAGMLMNRQASAGDEQANVRELVKQAQIMLKKGGGEMKLEMKPEGMGQVHLRVAVENGQVNVQMTTESDAAKHLLEKGLGELKASLASEHLKVEHLKVDVGRDIQKHMDQNSDSSREQARQAAQDFLGSFREDRQAFRDDMFGMDRYRMGGSNRSQDRVKMSPEPTSRSERTDSSRRLDLVA